jgi:Carboxypeptidase regulatory-like domain/CarboxypepD_reg-like domain
MTSRVLRGVGVLALLPLFGLVFWVAATVASGFPGLVAVAVNVHSLGLPSYAADSSQRPAPLSLQVLQDAYGDASRALISSTQVVGSHAPTPSPSPLPVPIPLPFPTPTPAPTPAPAIIGGQVLDSQTLQPIAAATVSVSPTGKSTLTDVNGNFSIGVDPGSYTVTASSPSYNSASQSVTVAAGQKATMTLRLVSIAAYGSISGKVIDSVTRTPIAGATVKLSDGMIRTTDLNGNFSYAIVLNGTYALTVSALSYLTQTTSVTVTSNHTTYVLVVLGRSIQRL